MLPKTSAARNAGNRGAMEETCSLSGGKGPFREKPPPVVQPKANVDKLPCRHRVREIDTPKRGRELSSASKGNIRPASTVIERRHRKVSYRDHPSLVTSRNRLVSEIETPNRMLLPITWSQFAGLFCVGHRSKFLKRTEFPRQRKSRSRLVRRRCFGGAGKPPRLSRRLQWLGGRGGG